MDLRPQLEPALVWATPGQRGFKQAAPAAKNVKAVKAAPQPAAPSYSQAIAGPSSSQRRPNTVPAQSAAQKEAARKLQESMQKAAELKQILTNLEKVDDEGRRNSLLDQLLSTDDVLKLPLHPNPPGIQSGELTVDLLKHQVLIFQTLGSWITS